MAFLLLEFELARRQQVSASQESQSSDLALGTGCLEHLESFVTDVDAAEIGVPSKHVCTVKRFRKQPAPSSSVPDTSSGLVGGDDGQALQPPFKVMRPTPKVLPLRPSAGVHEGTSMWMGQQHSGIAVGLNKPPPPLFSAFASRVPGLGTVPAPVPAPFGLGPRARIGSSDFAFGHVRNWSARPQCVMDVPAPLPRPALLTPRSIHGGWASR